jgi:hypothetical protein
MKRGLMLIAVIAATLGAATAQAGTWYEAEFCDHMTGCIIKSCERSDKSPVELSKSGGDRGPASDRIAELTDGEVIVVINHGDDKFTLFRTKKACQEFTAPLLKDSQENEKEEQKKEKPYE